MRAHRGFLHRAALIRAGSDRDAAGLIALIEACWAPYPGCVLDVEREAPELLAPASYYAGRGGALWVAGEAGGMVATVPLPGGAWEICRVYVHPSLHGTGLAHRLLDTAEAHAIAAGAASLVLWTDTRFLRAHRFYAKRGYARHGPVRALNDIAQSLEYEYRRPVPGAQGACSGGV